MVGNTGETKLGSCGRAKRGSGDIFSALLEVDSSPPVLGKDNTSFVLEQVSLCSLVLLSSGTCYSFDQLIFGSSFEINVDKLSATALVFRRKVR